MGPAGRILLAEDDPRVASMVAARLRRDGLDVEVCDDGRDALGSALACPPRLLLVGHPLPGMDGLQVMRALHRVADTPVIVLSRSHDVDSCVGSLRMGADDYVTQPFDPRELAARVTALLRRSEAPGGAAPVLAVAGLTVDLVGREVERDGSRIALTELEHALLTFLMRHPGRTFSRQELMQRVWDFSHGQPSAVTVQVRRLRAKIEPDPSRPRWIKTVHGAGYRFPAQPGETQSGAPQAPNLPEGRHPSW
ncbi:MAG: response regulator transcription factor [Euzebyales bacterium]|nr:response regulator transcription factor [Euzebyales bacterium]MBA3620763.1 response regulator transcription factor [Euzebyales bacterium]